MSGYWLTVLTSFASVATALIGFAGLITAFRAGETPLELPDIVAVRILLIFALAALVFSLLPLVAVGENGSWQLSTGLLGAFLLFWPLRSPSWNRARGYVPRRPITYWTSLLVMALVGGALIILALGGGATVTTYVAAVGLCLFVAILSFISQVFSLLPANPKR